MYHCILYSSCEGRDVCPWLDRRFTTATYDDSLEQLELRDLLQNSSYFGFSKCTSPIPEFVSYFLWKVISNDPDVYFLLLVRGVKDRVRFIQACLLLKIAKSLLLIFMGTELGSNLYNFF